MTNILASIFLTLSFYLITSWTNSRMKTYKYFFIFIIVLIGSLLIDKAYADKINNNDYFWESKNIDEVINLSSE